MRLKEWKLREGIMPYRRDYSSLSNETLLTLLFRDHQAAHELLRNFSLPELFEARETELGDIHGINSGRVEQLQAVVELGKRVSGLISCPEPKEKPAFRHAQDVFEFAVPQLKGVEVERFLVMLLDARNRLKRLVTLFQGSVNGCPLPVKDAFVEAVRERSPAVIFVHNHPSGDPTPSREDRTVTRRLCEAGRMLDINVLDHLIVGEGRYYSFADSGELKEETRRRRAEPEVPF